jgi:TonB family protein
MTAALRAILAAAIVIAAGKAAEAASASSAASANGGVLACHDPSVTPPVNQSVVSIKDSYPPLSTVLGEEGDVVVSFLVNANGTVSEVKVAQSSGFPRLDEATLRAAQQLLYTPAKSAGRTVACRNELRVRWRLTGDGSEEAAESAALNFVVPPKSAWPAGALAGGKEGASAVGVYIDTAGKVLHARVLKSSGTPELDDAAVAYVQKLRLKPAEVERKPVTTSIILVVIWSKEPPKLPHPALVSP